MTLHQRLFGAFFLCSAVWMTNGGAFAGDQQLTPQQMRAAAAFSVAQGANLQALALADALIARDPNDVDALVSRSRALRNLGRTDEAQHDAKHAYAHSETDLERFASAMAMAQALASDNKRTRAQLWLRRAGQNAPSKAAKMTARRDFRYVKSRNPWSTQLTFGIAPTDNVNGGSKNETSLITLPGGAQIELENAGNALPLSGTEFNAGLMVHRTISESSQHRLQAEGRLFGRTFRLSTQAQAQSPETKGSDFAFLSLGAGCRLQTGNLQNATEWNGSVERSHYAGALYGDNISLSTAQTFRWPTTGLRLGARAEDLTRHDIDETAKTLSISADIVHQLSSGDRITLRFGSGASHSDSSVLDHRTTRAGVVYARAQPIVGAKLALDFNLLWRSYDSYPLSLEGREDQRTTIGATMTLQQVELYGFNPTVRVEHAVNDSNLRREETVETRVSLGIRSSF